MGLKKENQELVNTKEVDLESETKIKGMWEDQVQLLQKELKEEKTERKNIQQKASILTEQVKAKYINENDCLKKDVDEVKSKFETEKRCRVDLENKVAQMNQIISTAQEALQQEKQTVELLRKRIPVPSTTLSSTVISGENIEPKSANSKAQTDSVDSINDFNVTAHQFSDVHLSLQNNKSVTI